MPLRVKPPASKRVLRSQKHDITTPSARSKARVSQTRPRKRRIKDLDPESDEPEGKLAHHYLFGPPIPWWTHALLISFRSQSPGDFRNLCRPPNNPWKIDWYSWQTYRAKKATTFNTVCSGRRCRTFRNPNLELRSRPSNNRPTAHYRNWLQPI